MNNIQDSIAISLLYQNKKSDPVTQFELCMEKIKTSKNVYLDICTERSVREAQASKKRWEENQPLSIFDGIPISWKDLYDIEGYTTTAASAIFKGSALKSKDSDLVSTLTQIGIVNIGKTNLSEFAYSGLGLNPYFGTPRNIHDSTRIPGGSSSGAAISVGLGSVPIAMGSDTAGSIRIPAALNGLVGYRSSHNRYSKNGIYELSKTLDTLGPIAHSVRDCIVLDDLINGKKVFSIPERNKNLSSYNFVIDEEILNHPQIEKSVKENFLKSVENLQKIGYQVQTLRFNAFRKTLEIVDNGLWLGAAEAFTSHEHILNSKEAKLIDPYIRKRLERSRDFPASKQIKLYFLQQQLIQQVKQELGDKLFLSPTIMHTAPEIEPLIKDEDLFFETNMRTLRLTMPGSFLDMPGVTLPNGFDENNLPTAILISSFSGDDNKVLNASYAIEEIV